MKIIIFTNSDMGIYKFRKELIENLTKKNDVLLYVPFGNYIDNIEEMGCRYISFEFDRRGMNPFEDIRQILKYIRILKEEKPDVALTYTIKPNVYGGVACRLTRTPYISNITGIGTAIENGGIVNKIAMGLYRVGLRRANCVFFQNKSNLKLFLDKKIINGQTRLIPGSGVNLLEHQIEEYPNDEGPCTFLFVGRIMKDKGINELLNATRIVHDTYPDIKLNIIGEFDEDYRQEIRLAEQTGYIHYLGVQNDVHLFYKSANCIVLPSYHEGTANVLLEAASTGRPIIATRVPGCKETFDENITGIGCNVKDVQGLAEAMIEFIKLSYEEKKKMGLRGRKKMEREFDRQIVTDAYLEEIKKVKKII